MFLIRSAFWLALIAMLLPSDPREQARLYQTASHALYQAATFCDRNQGICVEAERHWGVFKDKLAIGARMATDLVNERMAGQSPAAPAFDGLRPLETSAVPPVERQAPERRQRGRTQL